MHETRVWCAAAIGGAILIAGCTIHRPAVRSNATPAAATSETTDSDTAAGIAGILAAHPPAFVARDRDGRGLWQLTRQFYQKRHDDPAWFNGRAASPMALDLARAIAGADRQGLDPDRYHLSASELDEVAAVAVPALDVRLTFLYLEYASDLSDGVDDLPRADPNWRLRGEPADVSASLRAAMASGHVVKALDDLAPASAEYAGLRLALAHYRDLASRGGWPRLPADLKLKPGQSDPAVPVLARRLAVTGDYAGPLDEAETRYGPELQQAVRTFQSRHGLDPDAVVGAAAVAQMNVPVEDRIAEIALNLERMRWMPRNIGERYVLVNVPEYRLEVHDGAEVPLAMRVVVGKKDTPTPNLPPRHDLPGLLADWNVPADIVQRETLPSALKDPAFLERTHMEVLDRSGRPVDPAAVDLGRGGYRFRQRPGAANSLGLVKFMLPNEFNVYLHDTPAESLFGRVTRSFSHGCVRLEQPERLADYVLGDQAEWTLTGSAPRCTPERRRRSSCPNRCRCISSTGRRARTAMATSGSSAISTATTPARRTGLRRLAMRPRPGPGLATRPDDGGWRRSEGGSGGTERAGVLDQGVRGSTRNPRDGTASGARRHSRRDRRATGPG